MEFVKIIEAILAIPPFLVVKAMIVILLFLHIAFSGVVLRQVDFMIKVLSEERSGVLRSAALGHLGLSILVLLLSLIIL